ncbi:hypothetical protein C0993_005587, partial [Termitomyces sp. T159_Od127]
MNFRHKNRNNEGKDGTTERPHISPLFTDRVGLKYREALVTDRKKVAPLHNDEGDEVHTLGGVVEVDQIRLLEPVEPLRWGGGVFLKCQEERSYGNPSIPPI